MMQHAMILHFFNYLSSAGETRSRTLSYSMCVHLMAPFDLLLVCNVASFLIFNPLYFL